MQDRDNFSLPEDDNVLKQTTGVVKTVKELSDKIHKCKPNDYVDLVKVRRYWGCDIHTHRMWSDPDKIFLCTVNSLAHWLAKEFTSDPMLLVSNALVAI